MKKISKKFILLLALVFVMGFGIVSSAATTEFDIIVTRNGQNQDPISIRTWKYEDGDNYFYVTPTYCSTTGSYYVASINLENPSIRSSQHYIPSNGINVGYSFSYGSDVPDGEYYYLECYYNTASSSTMHIQGRYTP